MTKAATNSVLHVFAAEFINEEKVSKMQFLFPALSYQVSINAKYLITVGKRSLETQSSVRENYVMYHKRCSEFFDGFFLAYPIISRRLSNMTVFGFWHPVFISTQMLKQGGEKISI